MPAADLWRFVLVATPFVLTPGASTAVLVRNTAQDGKPAGVQTGIGLACGCVFYGCLTALGAGVLFERWPSSASILRIIGTAYIAWLGCRSLYTAWSAVRPIPRESSTGVERAGRRFVVEGFLTSALNPSVAAFYLLVLSQFAANSGSIAQAVAMLTAVHVTMAMSWYVAWILFTDGVTPRTGAGMPRAFHAVIGVALILLALRIASH